MPLINIKVAREATPLNAKEKKALIEGATDLLVNVLGKQRARTVVIIEEIDPDSYGFGGESITEVRKKS
ncbi:tautomerase family protein [Helicobacter suis]|uniref:tautomerase family protein n=1 Tax=Helicobacter suis TaxID=104628 RepID=UPI0013D87A26|nr:4-oxalocrotonate tautomerase family protein [Helicobacter suis]